MHGLIGPCRCPRHSSLPQEKEAKRQQGGEEFPTLTALLSVVHGACGFGNVFGDPLDLPAPHPSCRARDLGYVGYVGYAQIANDGGWGRWAMHGLPRTIG
jgi:hypothetical protein